MDYHVHVPQSMIIILRRYIRYLIVDSRISNIVYLSPCPYPRLVSFLKEELHNRFNLISEERVNIFKHNSENLMKIGWKIRKLWHFEVSQIFKKHFLTSQYEYANEWGDDVIDSHFSIHFVHRNDKNLILQLWKC